MYKSLIIDTNMLCFMTNQISTCLFYHLFLSNYLYLTLIKLSLINIYYTSTYLNAYCIYPLSLSTYYLSLYIYINLFLILLSASPASRFSFSSLYPLQHLHISSTYPSCSVLSFLFPLITTTHLYSRLFTITLALLPSYILLSTALVHAQK